MLYISAACDIIIWRSRGEIGRRVGFRFRWETVWVQVPSAAPDQNNTNQDGKSRFVLFFARDYFGVIVLNGNNCRRNSGFCQHNNHPETIRF